MGYCSARYCYARGDGEDKMTDDEKDAQVLWHLREIAKLGCPPGMGAPREMLGIIAYRTDKGVHGGEVHGPETDGVALLPEDFGRIFSSAGDAWKAGLTGFVQHWMAGYPAQNAAIVLREALCRTQSMEDLSDTAAELEKVLGHEFWAEFCGRRNPVKYPSFLVRPTVCVSKGNKLDKGEA